MADSTLSGLTAITLPVATTDILAIGRSTDRLNKITVANFFAKLPTLTDNGIVTTSGGDGTLSVTATTGSGNVVLATSATLTTPNIGTPSAGTLTNCTGLPIASGVSGLGTGVATALAVNTGAAGAVVLFDGALGTPSSGTLTNATGLPIASGISGLGTGIATALAVNTGSAGAPVLFNGAGGTPSSLTLTNATGLPVSSGISGLGTGVATALAVNVGSAGAPVLFDGALGTPSSATLTNATGLPISTGVSGLGANVATFLATPSSANLASAVTDETGSGALVFATSPTLVTPTLGTPASGTLTNCTGLPASSLTAATLAANITLGEDNGQIVLDAALSADGKYSGIIEAGTAGATLAFGDLIYFAAADSRWELADASAASTSGTVKLGMCVLAAAADGDPTTILLMGKIRADTAFPAMTVGAPMYVSETEGDITGTAPTTTDSVTRVCGYANTADELYFNPDGFFITHT